VQNIFSDLKALLCVCVCVIVYSLEKMFGGTELLSGHLPHYSDPGC
jgi:hypothetical protein